MAWPVFWRDYVPPSRLVVHNIDNRNKYLVGSSELGQCFGVVTFRSIYIILFTKKNKYLGGSFEPGSVLWRDCVPLTRLAVQSIISLQNLSLGQCSGVITFRSPVWR